MNITLDLIKELEQENGSAFYLLDTSKFEENYDALLTAFRTIYANTYISYSYKTNYIPLLCKIIQEHGGYAETVSDMEISIARKLGIPFEKIIYNGPAKSIPMIKKVLLGKGIVNVDSMDELKDIQLIAFEESERTINISLRCNFDIMDGQISRFGFDILGKDFHDALHIFNLTPNLNIIGIHCHFSTRRLEKWSIRVNGMLKIIDKYFGNTLKYVSLGGGMFGKMPPSLEEQFHVKIPSYEEYAFEAAGPFQKYYEKVEEKKRPKLFIEPGSAIVGDAMQFITKVIGIKQIQKKNIATLLGSIYNINPTLNTKNMPIQVIHDSKNKEIQKEYFNLDFGGYTCIESDYLFKGYNGMLAKDDYIVFGNIGSYSIVLKPPFILPNFPVLAYNKTEETVTLVKRKETFEDIFSSYMFE